MGELERVSPSSRPSVPQAPRLEASSLSVCCTGWFYHNPYDGHGIWWPELPTYPAAPDSLDSLRKEGSQGA